MKIKTLLFVALALLSFNAVSQTLYVPSGTNGIGSSGNANIGIGLSNPGDKLHIKNATDNSFLRIETGANQKYAGLKLVGSHNGSTATSQIYMDYYGLTNHHGLNYISGRSGYDHHWFKNSAGNVLFAIKTQSSGFGRIVIPANAMLEIGTDNPDNGFLRVSTVTNCYNTYADYKGNVYFRADGIGGSSLGLQKDGTVVIGIWEKYDNTSIDLQGNKLLVNGGILCQQVKVIADVPDADYVFDADYNLMSLDKVADFIQNNKHLPNIPSAVEFKTNGYKVGEMDEMLLRKVEEITLYLIEQNKRIAALEEENKQLRAKMNL